MVRTINKKIAGLVLGSVVVGTGVAYAYWTVGGSGSGTAATGDVAAVTVVQTAVTGLAPGLAATTLSGTFTNPNPGPVYVGTLTASISGVVKAVGAPSGVCDATDYTLSSATRTINAEVLADDTSTWSGVTIAFNNKASNQDACKNATVNLSYAIS